MSRVVCETVYLSIYLSVQRFQSTGYAKFRWLATHAGAFLALRVRFLLFGRYGSKPRLGSLRHICRGSVLVEAPVAVHVL